MLGSFGVLSQAGLGGGFTNWESVKTEGSPATNWATTGPEIIQPG